VSYKPVTSVPGEKELRFMSPLFRKSPPPSESASVEPTAIVFAIRPYEESRDFEACRALYFRSREVAFPWANPRVLAKADFRADTLGELLAVAETESNLLVGFVGIWQPENFIHHLYVDPEFFRQGIGKALLNHALTLIKRPARLRCQTRNKRAYRFYRYLGWRTTERGVDEIGSWIEFVYD